MVDCLAHLKWIQNRLPNIASSVPEGVTLSIQIYITSNSPSVDDLEKNNSLDVEKKHSRGDSDDKKSISRSLIEEHDNIAIYDGRPDMLKLLEDEVKASDGPVSVDGMLHFFYAGKSTMY